MLTTQVRAVDVVVSTESGVNLRGRWWKGANAAATVVIAHGLGEHGGSYGHVAEELAGSLGIDVLAVDFRGHGRSPGRRGVIRRYDIFVDDLRDVVNWAARQKAGHPVFVLGHSNGGQVSLRLAAEGCPAMSGLIVSNPAIRIALAVPKHKILIGKVLRAVAPWVTLSSGSPSTDLTRDPKMHAAFLNDSLRHSRINPPFYFGMVEGEQHLMSRARTIRVPLLMILGSHDPVIDPIRSREFFEQVGSPDKTLVIYPGMLHEPLNEIGREQVIGEIARWIHQRINVRESVAG